ncbi:L-xylulose/3-keto-L-gulonate kinase [Providencia stuartii]|nr:L-xylulose/3-keto-L-gulonate kinase [Providencia stuartii]
MKKYILGIDNGGTVTKAAIYNLEGQVLAIASNTTRMITPKPFFTERDIEELWQSNLLVIKEVLKKSVIDAADIIGISVTGHGNGLYLVDEQGKPTRNGIISTDNRAKKYVEQWYQSPKFESEIPT